MNNSSLSPKVKYFTVYPSRFVFKVFVCLFFLSQIISAQYRFDSFTTDNGLPQNGVRGIAQTPDGYLWFTTFDGLVRYDGAKFTVFDKSNSPGILSNRFAQLHIEPDGTLFAGTEDGGLTVYRDGKFRTFTVADGLPSNTITFFRTDAKGEFIIDTAGGICYFRDGEFNPVPATELPGDNRFYRSPTNNLWLYGENSIRQITPDKREIIYPVKIARYNPGFSGFKFFEDSAQNFWFGDLSGVYCLKDGNVTKFTAQDGVPPDTILRPYLEDDEGGIWFSTGWFGIQGAGLARFFQGKFSNWGASAGLSNLAVGQLFKDREGTIWAATDRGINHLQKQFIESFSIGDGLIHSEVYPLLQTRSGDIYVGTTRGLSLYRDGKFTEVNVRNSLGDKLSATAFYEDAAGRLWIGAVGGLHRMENGRLTEINELYMITVWAVQSDRRGDVWVASAKGLYRFRDDKLIARYTTAEGLPSDDIKVIHEDKNGALWFGTYGGLVKLENDKFVSFTTLDGLASDRVRTIYEEPSGTLWIGTYDGGISRFRDGKFFNFTIENGLFNNGVFQIFEDEKGNFWISCNRGIFRVSKHELEDLADGKISKINSFAYGKQDGMLNTESNGGRQPAGIKTPDGKFWFPTQDGIAVVDPKKVSFNPNPPPVAIESVLIERETTDFRAGGGIELKADDDNLEIRYTGISFIKPEQVKFRYRIEGLDGNWTDVGTIREVYFPSLPSGEYVFQVIAANSDGVWNEEGARLKIRVNAPFWRKTWFFALIAAAAILLIFAAFRWRVRQLERRQIMQQEFSRKLLASQEQERQRIAAELHDSIGQSLLIIKNRAFLALSDLEEPENVKEQLEELSDSAANAIEECREISYNLRPFQIERFGLTKTLEAIFKRISEVSDTVVATTDVDSIDNLFAPEAETNIYRVVQESVNNIIKHSAATRAALAIKKRSDKVEISIRDNGRGFDAYSVNINENERGGFGLMGIAERVRMLGGSCEISSQPGTNIEISLPISRNDNRN
ncbi:MAG TPA: two-component regulator propeller domain-containing protein [Pyrinomonadaceae bacterium]|jgi:signal transduction histidine kinase/ligand-binding sensor domain-containing protein